MSAIHAQFQSGERDAGLLVEVGRDVISEESSIRLDYLEIVDPDTLEPILEITSPALAAVAAFVGTTRLIDNVLLYPAP
jgi:pantothenate synthetase